MRTTSVSVTPLSASYGLTWDELIAAERALWRRRRIALLLVGLVGGIALAAPVLMRLSLLGWGWCTTCGDTHMWVTPFFAHDGANLVFDLVFGAFTR